MTRWRAADTCHVWGKTERAGTQSETTGMGRAPQKKLSVKNTPSDSGIHVYMYMYMYM